LGELVNGFRVVSSTPFQDGGGNRLAVILETNDRAWKLFVRHTPRGLPSRESEWRVFPTLELGRQFFEETVQEVEGMGWPRS
jgi:hypothetical protein